MRPQDAIEIWDVRPGEKIADFGCGAGYFSVPLGQRVGTGGRVYALDIRPESLEATRAKAKLFRVYSVETSQANLENAGGSGLREESVNKIIISNILFQTQHKQGLAQEAYRVLKPGGTIMVIEWSEEKNSGGPPLADRVNREEAEKYFLTAGFVFYKEFSAGSHHYGLIFKK